MNTRNLYISIILVLVAGGAFWYVSNHNTAPDIDVPKDSGSTTISPDQTGKIDEHLTIDNTLREVNFCGKTYQVKQIIIDGVDVVQRVGELVTQDLIPEKLKIGPYLGNEEWKDLVTKQGEMAERICRSISLSTSMGIIHTDEMTTFPYTYFGNKGETVAYVITFSGLRFLIHPETNEIFITSEYDGALIGPIGTLE